MLNTQIALEKMHDRSFKHLFNNQTFSHFYVASPMVQQVKNLSANARDTGDMGLIPGLGRSPGGGNGNPLQYFCLGNPMERGAWRARVHEVARVGHDLVTKQQ